MQRPGFLASVGVALVSIFAPASAIACAKKSHVSEHELDLMALKLEESYTKLPGYLYKWVDGNWYFDQQRKETFFSLDVRRTKNPIPEGAEAVVPGWEVRSYVAFGLGTGKAIEVTPFATYALSARLEDYDALLAVVVSGHLPYRRESDPPAVLEPDA